MPIGRLIQTPNVMRLLLNNTIVRTVFSFLLETILVTALEG